MTLQPQTVLFLIAPDPLPQAPGPLTPFQILELVGFATGGALHLYLCLMLYRRYGIRHAERTLLALGLSAGLWHLGNFAAAIHDLLVGAGRAVWWLKASNIVAYTALAFMPPVLIHAHFRVWEWLDKRAPRRLFKPLIIAGYLPLLVLPWAIARLWSDPNRPPMEPIDRLAPLLLPFILWFVIIFIECAVIDWRLARKWEAARERRFFEVFGTSLAVIGALFLVTYVLGAKDWKPLGPYLELIGRLSSVAPTTIIAYFIYRYRYLELVIRQSFVYAILAALVMMVYIYGIRRISLALNASYGVSAEGIEALLILVVIVLAGPLRRATEHYLRRLFTREVKLYRELVAQVGAASASYGELRHFIEFAEGLLLESLELKEITITASADAQNEEAEICRIAEERQFTEIEDSSLLERLRAVAAYALWREGRVVGLLVVRGDAHSLTAEKREVLVVLAGHLAAAIENCQLLEEKVKLERALGERERLAQLGQMAATVAHEVKNPLSAIKSIAQVMREDERVSREYGRDLDLITGEVDRLSGSVSQLLSFSRPSSVAGAPARLSEIMESVLALTRSEAEQRGVAVSSDLRTDPELDGEKIAPLKEVLLNLVFNALHAIKRDWRDGEVKILCATNGDGHLTIAITDNGIGIPSSMQDKIFEPFFTTKTRGTGLGLAIVARRVRELGGTITLASPISDGRGARFEIALSAPRSNFEL
ncbi:MAG TPA: ATP-binding protein [Blastocatellia bacterium]|nr:ATP-binding protein [Blastocatellia bacterium]